MFVAAILARLNLFPPFQIPFFFQGKNNPLFQPLRVLLAISIFVGSLVHLYDLP